MVSDRSISGGPARLCTTTRSNQGYTRSCRSGPHQLHCCDRRSDWLKQLRSCAAARWDKFSLLEPGTLELRQAQYLHPLTWVCGPCAFLQITFDSFCGYSWEIWMDCWFGKCHFLKAISDYLEKYKKAAPVDFSGDRMATIFHPSRFESRSCYIACFMTALRWSIPPMRYWWLAEAENFQDRQRASRSTRCHQVSKRSTRLWWLYAKKATKWLCLHHIGHPIQSLAFF